MHKRFMLATTALLAFAVTAQAETLQEVQNKLHDIVSKYKSLQMKQKLTSEMKMEGGGSSKSDGEIQIEAMKKDGIVMSRVDTKMRSVTAMAGQEYKMDIKSLQITDGKTTWTISEAPQKGISKSRYDPQTGNYFDYKAGWKQEEKIYDVKLMPDETVDGKSCWVFSKEPKDPALKMAQSKTVFYYDKKTDLAPKIITFGPDGKKVGEYTTSDVKIDADIPSDRFTYSPPAGAEVDDQTKGGAPDMASDKEAPKSAEKTGAGKEKD